MPLDLIDGNPNRTRELDSRGSPRNRIARIDEHHLFSLIDQVFDLSDGESGRIFGHQVTRILRRDERASSSASVGMSTLVTPPS